MMTRTLTALSALCIASSAFAQEPTTPPTISVKPAPVQGKTIAPKLKMPTGKRLSPRPRASLKSTR